MRKLRSMGEEMESRPAVVAIIIKKPEAAAEVNSILHEYSDVIIGRMGIPYRERSINIISVVVDCPISVTNALAGKLGKIENVTSKAVYSPVMEE